MQVIGPVDKNNRGEKRWIPVFTGMTEKKG